MNKDESLDVAELTACLRGKGVDTPNILAKGIVKEASQDAARSFITADEFGAWQMQRRSLEDTVEALRLRLEKVEG